MNSWFFIIFIGVFYAIGVGMLGYGLLSLKRSTEAGDWPTAVGSIDECQISRKDSGENVTYGVEVKYSYSVNGKEYQGDKLAFGYAFSSARETHQEILEKLKAAQSVEVRYDPFHPENSVLSYGVHRSILYNLAFSISWLLFTIGFSVIAWIGSKSDTVLLENLTTQ